MQACFKNINNSAYQKVDKETLKVIKENQRQKNLPKIEIIITCEAQFPQLKHALNVEANI